ncbi:MAG: hypothetical protein AVDCRST_MAG73-4248, partial [uncultured Thermomicrobiales bacterium]
WRRRFNLSVRCWCFPVSLWRNSGCSTSARGSTSDSISSARRSSPRWHGKNTNGDSCCWKAFGRWSRSPAWSAKRWSENRPAHNR